MKMNSISECTIGQEVKDKDGQACKILNMTSNSIELTLKGKGEHGIDCTNWFTEGDFLKRFTKLV